MYACEVEKILLLRKSNFLQICSPICNTKKTKFEFSFQEVNNAEFTKLITLQNSVINQIRGNLKKIKQFFCSKFFIL